MVISKKVVSKGWCEESSIVVSASDLGARGRGSIITRRHVLSLSKTKLLSKSTGGYMLTDV